MELVKLGRTGLDVSRLCLGTMGFGGRGGPTHPWALSAEDSAPFFRTAIESGINFFDTADHYNHGASEIVTGMMLKEYANRDEIVVATKVGLSMGEGANRTGLSRKRIVEGIDASLKRLGMDHVELFYVHRLDDTPFEEIIAAFDDVVRAGKALYPAASSMPVWQFVQLREMQKREGFRPFAAMQNLVNLVYREEEREMLPYCAAEGIGVVPWSPIARGFLAGNKPREGGVTERAKIDKSGGLFGADQDYDVLDVVEATAQRMGHSAAQIAYAWVLGHSAVTSPIVGATKLPQLKEAIEAVDIVLDAEALAAFDKAYRPRDVMGYRRPVAAAK